MLEVTDFCIFKSESVNEYADSWSGYSQFFFETCCPLETIKVSATTSPYLDRLQRKRERCFKNGQKGHFSHMNEQISKEIGHISYLITRKLFAFSTSKGIWSTIKLVTGERNSSNESDETRLDEINASVTFDRSAPDLGPLSLQMKTAQVFH